VQCKFAAVRHSHLSVNRRVTDRLLQLVDSDPVTAMPVGSARDVEGFSDPPLSTTNNGDVLGGNKTDRRLRASILLNAQIC
jgi:hypothetical protein